ncbi:hypothetical protein N431DRAFT_436836 [Stipitochalara longipes BDJ]|nr:hypothetical protein N431DRAFT_436836 [Stipitochalara longipes BDJ]
MSSSSQPKQTIMVLGSTGGCTLNFTIRALQEGHSVSALVRTASKLTNLLKENKVSDDQLKNLTIVQGNSKNETDMAKALQLNGQVVDIIESGIGAVPKFKNLIPHIEDPTICADTMTTLFKALASIRDASPSTYKRPILIGISTTGISEYGRDLPLAMIPVYAALASGPHKDKKLMEKMIKTEGNKEGGLISGWCIVRASFLEMGTKDVGWENLKVGVEENGKPMPKSAIGWTISRPDVGRWIFAALVQDKAGIMKERYLNHCVGITA